MRDPIFYVVAVGWIALIIYLAVIGARMVIGKSYRRKWSQTVYKPSSENGKNELDGLFKFTEGPAYVLMSIFLAGLGLYLLNLGR
jgi:isoprenylcysteine carboxyl methyltransferase (ICMT) family protein YpbQ